MKRRRRISNVRADKRIFTRTARRTKKVNLGLTIPRGGIRL